jgi:hypothetical protein
MARKTVEDRTKSGPRLPMWSAIRSKYKEIAGYKPDITGSVKSYDADVAKAADLADTKKQLTPQVFDEWSKDNEAMGKQISEHLNEVDALHDKFILDFQKMTNEMKAKPDRTVDLLDDFDNRAESFVKARKALWDAVVKLDTEHLASQKKLIKKIRDSLAKVDKEQEAKLVDCDKLEASIRKTVSEYQKKAAGGGNDNLVDALDNFMAGF